MNVEDEFISARERLAGERISSAEKPTRDLPGSVESSP